MKKEREGGRSADTGTYRREKENHPYDVWN